MQRILRDSVQQCPFFELDGVVHLKDTSRMIYVYVQGHVAHVCMHACLIMNTYNGIIPVHCPASYYVYLQAVHVLILYASVIILTDEHMIVRQKIFSGPYKAETLVENGLSPLLQKHLRTCELISGFQKNSGTRLSCMIVPCVKVRLNSLDTRTKQFLRLRSLSLRA